MTAWTRTVEKLVSRRSALYAIGAAPLLFGCESKSKLAPVSLQAPWVNDAEFIGYFIGIDKGYYREQKIDFTYIPGGPDIVADMKVLSRSADIALTTPDFTVKAMIDEGAPFKIIGTQYQKSPMGIVSLKKSGISEPKDLTGKTVAVPAANVITFEAFLTINGIAKDRVKRVPYQYDPTPLIKGEVDATLDFVTNVPHSIALQGQEPASFLLYDYGFKIFMDTVVVLEETLVKRRKELVGWLRASRRGWIENFRDIEQYPRLFAQTHFRGTGRTVENEIFFNRAQKALIESPGGIFSMAEKDIHDNIETLNKVGLKARKDMFVTDLLLEV